MQRASLKQNIVALYLLQAANYLIPILTLPYLVRTLGLDAYGSMSFAYALTFFMVLFVDAGFNLSATRELAALKSPLEELDRTRMIYWRTQITKAFLVLACFVLLVILVIFVPTLHAQWSLFLISFFTVIGSLSFPVWVFQGLEQMRFTTFLFLGGRLLATALIFLLVKRPADLLLAAFLQCGATFFSGMLAQPVLFMHFRLRWLWPGWGALRLHFVDGRSYFLSDFSSAALNNASVFVLGLFQSKELVGVFAAMEKLARAMASGFAPVQRALFPRVTASYELDTSEGQMFAARLIRLMGAGACVAAIIVIVLAPHALHVVFGEKFTAYTRLLQILSFWLVFLVLNAGVGEYIFVARGLMHELARCQHMGNVILLLGLPLVAALAQPAFVLNAVALVMLAAQAVLFVLMLLRWRQLR